jgi:hypothetical protein
VVALAAVIVLLAVAAGSLAAAGALHVRFGHAPRQRHVTQAHALILPPGANGISAVVGGRLSVVTRSGFRLQGLPVSAAALSPHALYVAAGVGGSLVAIKPSGRTAWSHRVGGTVVAIAWAPDGLRIAYVVRTAHRLALRVIWGNGTHDRAIERPVRAVRPSWRADSLAFAYVGAGGHAVVYDIGHESRGVVGSAAPVTRLAFAPAGRLLLVATPASVLLGGKTVATGEVEALGWFHGRPAAALGTHRPVALVRTFGRKGRPLEGFRVPGSVVGLTGGLVVTRTRERVLAGWREKRVGTVLDVGRTASIEDLAIG